MSQLPSITDLWQLQVALDPRIAADVLITAFSIILWIIHRDHMAYHFRDVQVPAAALATTWTREFLQLATAKRVTAVREGSCVEFDAKWSGVMARARAALELVG